jgi:hypothetical protein
MISSGRHGPPRRIRATSVSSRPAGPQIALSELTGFRAQALSRVVKFHGDSMEDTDLKAVLADAGVGRLVVVGAQTDACIRSTIHGGFVRGYDVTLVSDGHTTEDQTAWGAPEPQQVIAHTNLYWGHETGVGRTAAIVETKDAGFGAH